MDSYNKIQLVGTIDKAPDIKVTTNGHSLSKFTLIVPRLESLPNERFDNIPVTAWRENAEKTAEFKSGDIIYIDGRILTNSFEDEQTSQPSIEELAKDIDNISFSPVDETSFFNESKTDKNTKAQSAEIPNETSSENELEEDVPF